MSVAFFTRILNFKQAFLSRLRDKRSQSRFAVGAGFPLKATIILSGDNAGSKKGASGSGLSWSGRAGNISGNGLSVLLPPAALTARGEETSLRLTLDDHEIDLSCSVAHFRVFATHSLCGVKLNFDDFNVQKAYHQIVEAVRVGTSFEPAAASAQTSGALVRQQWRSVNRSTLTEWRNATTRKIERFELAIGEHRLAGHVSPPSVLITSRGSNSKAPVPADTAIEVRDFFRWVAANLPKSVPADLRDLMNRLTSSDQLINGGWAAPTKSK